MWHLQSNRLFFIIILIISFHCVGILITIMTTATHASQTSEIFNLILQFPNKAHNNYSDIQRQPSRPIRKCLRLNFSAPAPLKLCQVPAMSNTCHQSYTPASRSGKWKLRLSVCLSRLFCCLESVEEDHAALNHNWRANTLAQHEPGSETKWPFALAWFCLYCFQGISDPLKGVIGCPFYTSW